MGLLLKLKSMFNKNIDCSKELEGVFFHIIPMAKPITIGSNIIVKEGYQAIFVCKNKVTDILQAGKHKLDNNTIPYTFRRLKLYKIDKHGNMPKKFKCDIYFVQKSRVENFGFSSSQPYIEKSERFGKVFAYSEGVCNFIIEDAQKLLEYLLLEHAYVKDKRAIIDISAIIGNGVNEILEECPMTLETILTDNEKVYMYINTNIDKKLEFCGLKCDKVRLNSMEVSSKVQKKIDEYLKVQNEYKQQFSGSNEFQFQEVYKSFEMKENKEIQSEFSRDDEIPAYLDRGDLAKRPQKQCMYCGKYINQTAKYCEFCGFNQDMDGN